VAAIERSVSEFGKPAAVVSLIASSLPAAIASPDAAVMSFTVTWKTLIVIVPLPLGMQTV
jgi:hypothetical protein